MRDYMLSDAYDMDTFAASRANKAGKGRAKAPKFGPYAKRYYADRGRVYEDREQKIWIKDCKWPMSMDYKGIFDGVIVEGGREIEGIQLCSKEGVTAHVRKMLSDKRRMAGYRRKNLLEWWSQGKKSTILWFWQPKGTGSKWEAVERPVTRADLERILEGKTVTLDGVYK